MGAVHRAVDPLIERDVAIKTLLPNLPPEIMTEVRERFLREARSAGRLNHPNIVTIYDVGEQDGVAYIAMELLEGKSLQQVMRETPRIPIATIADLVAQVADGLDLAQRFKITHRDIKPANIMVSAEGRAKVTDFGVAHVASSSMTQTGSALGSPKYMSPEAVTGQPVDPRSDIFSLGVVLYEMLTRRTPFERSGDNTVFAVMHRIAAEPHALVTQIDPQIPVAFNAILERALAKTPDKRYQRGGDLANDLRHYKGLQGGADHAKTVAVPRPQAKPATADAATATLIDDLDVFAKQFEQQQQETLRAEAEERARKEAEIQRWADEKQARRRAFERERETKARGTQAGTRQSAALDMLQQKVADRTSAVGADQTRKLAAPPPVDGRLRAAFHSRADFTTVLNEANPVSDGKQGVMFFGDRAGMILGEGFTDLRTREVHGKSCADYVTFKYRVRFPSPEKLEIAGAEAQRVQERLKTLGVKHEFAGKKNELGQIVHGSFVLTGPFPCQAVIRADYDEPGFTLELLNVRHHGPAKVRLEAEELNDEVLDEFGTWVLGADDAFERFLKRK